MSDAKMDIPIGTKVKILKTVQYAENSYIIPGDIGIVKGCASAFTDLYFIRYGHMVFPLFYNLEFELAETVAYV